MTDDLEQRLRAVDHRDRREPDLGAIRSRARTLIRRRRVGAGAGACAAIVAGVFAVGAVTERSTVVETEASAPTASTQPESSDPATDEPGTADWTERLAAADAAMGDGETGHLVLEANALVHLTADGEATPIELVIPDGFTVEHTPTDLVAIDGVHHLLIDRFVNRVDESGPEYTDFLSILYAEATAVPELVESFNDRHGVAFTVDADLEDAQPMRAELIVQWMEVFPPDVEFAILAIDLSTHEVIEVERREVDNTLSPEWFANGHITSDGTNLLVMRELWQGACHFAEGLTLDGTPVDVQAGSEYPRPTGFDGLSGAEIQRLQEALPLDCYRVADPLDAGLVELGRVSTDPSFDAFAATFADAFG